MVGSLGLALFFFWSAVDDGDVPFWLAILGLFGAITTLAAAGVEIRRRRRRGSQTTTRSRS
jgi:hypothetical protein